jgi:hypothetical protein
MTILGADNFANNGRVLTNGWNTSYDGQVWAILGGAASHFSVTAGSGGVGGKGQITGATGAQTAVLGSGTSADQDIRVRVSVTGATDNVSAFGRVQAVNTGYRARLTGTQFQLVSIVAGTITVIASTPFTTTANTNYQMHLRLRGTTISGSIWLDGTIEPSTFMLSVTDSSVTGAGQYGITTALNATTDFAYFDQFVATNPTPVADTPYGVTVGLNNKTPPTANYANWHSLFADFFALGLSWLRFQLDWQLIDTATTSAQNPATYSWTPLDDAVNRCNEAGINLAFPIRGAPTWALLTANMKATTEPWYLSDATMTATFAGQVATRYNNANGHGFLPRIELGNEQDNIHFTPANQGFLGIYNSPFSEYNGLSGVNINVQPARDPHFFALKLAAMSNAISSASATTKIVLTAIWWNRFPNCADFLTVIYQEVANAKTYFSAGNFHFYSNTRAPDLAGSGSTYSPSFQQEWQAMQTAMTNAGDAGKAIDCTEVGWGTNANGGAPIDCDINTQASRFSYVLNNAKGSGIVAHLFFFTLDYKTQDVNANPITSTSSLVQWDVPSQTYIKLPAWTTWQGFVAANPTWTPPAVVTVPAVSRRSGGTLPAISRRDGTGVTAIKRRDGTGMVAIKRRDGQVTATKRRDGVVTTTRRRG